MKQLVLISMPNSLSSETSSRNTPPVISTPVQSADEKAWMAETEKFQAVMSSFSLMKGRMKADNRVEKISAPRDRTSSCVNAW